MMRVHISLIFCSHFLCLCTQKWDWIAGSHGICIFNFFRNLYTVLQVAVAIYTTSILSSSCYLCSLDDNHSDRSEVTFHCGFDLYFSAAQ